MQPLLEAATAAFFMSGCEVVWIIMREVDVVEVAEAQQLRLAAEELDAARPRLLHAPLHVAVLLGGHREEDHAAGQVLEGARLEQAHRGAEQPRDLRVVAARVRGARLRIGHRMAGHHQAVELAEQGEGRAVLGARRLGAHAGQGQPAARLEAELAEGLLDQPRGLELLEAELGLAPDALAERDDALRVAVDGGADGLLEDSVVWSVTGCAPMTRSAGEGTG